MKKARLAIVVAVLAVPAAAHACEPILSLVRISGGAELFVRSLVWLGIAVALYWRLGAMGGANFVSSLIGVLAAVSST